MDSMNREHSRTVTVDDLQGLSLNEDVLSYDHQELALICEQHDTLKPLAPVLKRIAEHHALKAMAYRIIAQRLVDEEILNRIRQRREKYHMRRQGITILLFLLTMLMLAGGTVVYAQISTQEATPVEATSGSPVGATVEPTTVSPDEDLSPVQEVGVLRQILLAIGSYFAGIGTIVLAGPRILSSIRNDKALLTFGEYLYKSVPADRQQLVTTVGTAAGDLSEIIKEVSDDEPVLTKGRDSPLVQRGGAIVDNLNDPGGIG